MIVVGRKWRKREKATCGEVRIRECHEASEDQLREESTKTRELKFGVEGRKQSPYRSCKCSLSLLLLLFGHGRFGRL